MTTDKNVLHEARHLCRVHIAALQWIQEFAHRLDDSPHPTSIDSRLKSVAHAVGQLVDCLYPSGISGEDALAIATKRDPQDGRGIGGVVRRYGEPPPEIVIHDKYGGEQSLRARLVNIVDERTLGELLTKLVEKAGLTEADLRDCDIIGNSETIAPEPKS